MQNSIAIKKYLLEASDSPIESVFESLKASPNGLEWEEAKNRLVQYGKNEVLREKTIAWYWMILDNFKNPFVMVLILLGTVSYFTKDLKATLVVSIMVVVSVLTRFIQEYRSSQAAEKLRTMVSTKATVRRKTDTEGETKEEKGKSEVPFEELVPGDIIYLSAGDMVPADIRLIKSKDLFLSQSALTGESLPSEKYDVTSQLIEKSAHPHGAESGNPLERNNLCFMGTSVTSGFGKGIVITTGERTYFGRLAKGVLGERTLTSFDKGINRVTWVLIRTIIIMVPIIFIMNGIIKGDWQESFLFAIAVAVGLTPELLPMIVTANLARGAVAMSNYKVIVKRLNSIQNFGAMDILCTDKTGTLTQDKIILEKYLDITGSESIKVLEYGFLNSHFQTGLKNVLDRAILTHGETISKLTHYEAYTKIDEIPFDFIRKRLSVIVQNESSKHLLICKGSVDELIQNCSQIDTVGEVVNLKLDQIQSVKSIAEALNNDGFRVIAIAYKNLEPSGKTYSVKDEVELTLLGLMAFLDPPKETAREAIRSLHRHGVKIKVLTGDNEIITKRICKEVNLPAERILLGSEMDEMSDKTLSKTVEKITVFARLSPLQKARIIKILRDKDHTVGFLGDGINDAPALREADVGISADTATDIARESADIILLEKSLLVLGEGVLKGREVYGNIIKYIKMTISSNFGNVFTILIASAFLPFLPLLPLQILVQNLLYDFSQLSLPWDRMDKEFLRRPRKWQPKGITKFMVSIGPISSVFDITTFLVLWFVFKANSLETQSLFQTGWFVESLLSQTLVVHMIRTRKIPFIQSSATLPVTLSTLALMGLGLYLPFSTFGATIQLVPLPISYFPWLFFTLLAYFISVQLVKMWYIKKFRSWL